MKPYVKALKVLHAIEDVTDQWTEQELDDEESMIEIRLLINNFLYPREETE